MDYKLELHAYGIGNHILKIFFQLEVLKNHFLEHEILYCSWIDAAKFLTGAAAVAIPIILRHARMIETAVMFMCFHRESLEDEW
uniref:Uncharacterized protein n=1 Tax=Populus trichocarpa TaxID=3694 RepID=A0A2K1XCA4_POPTR